MSKHTHGQWEVKKWRDGSIDIVVPISEKRLKGVAQVVGSDKYGETEANAALIAAAPELLEVAQKAITAIKPRIVLLEDKHLDYDADILQSVVNILQDAINKATNQKEAL